MVFFLYFYPSHWVITIERSIHWNCFLLTKENIRRIVMSLERFGFFAQRIKVFLDSLTKKIIHWAIIFNPNKRNTCTGCKLAFMYIHEELVKSWNRKNVQYPYYWLVSLDLTKQAYRFSTEFHKAVFRRITHTVICTHFSLEVASTRHSTFVWGSFHVLAFMGTMRDGAYCVLKYPKDCLQNKENRHTV